jgi:dynein heavy chain, axonemal
MWFNWDHDIDKYDITGVREDEKKNKNKLEEDTDGANPLSPKSMGSGQLGFSDGENADDIEFQNIMIATEDSIKNSYLLEKLIGHSFPILMIGETGTGKTQGIKKFIGRLLDQGNWESGEIVLSATTTALQVQEYNESRLEKHKKGVYGPKNPTAKLLIFVDDLNMPAREKYGAQPSLEMMRQIVDNGGFFNNKTNDWMTLIN